jgi:SAM-dependent methyltransferase
MNVRAGMLYLTVDLRKIGRTVGGAPSKTQTMAGGATRMPHSSLTSRWCGGHTEPLMPYQPFANQAYRNVIQTWLEIPALLRLVPVASGCSILEVGCGAGVALPRFAQLCKPRRLVGLDIAPELVAQARERIARAGVRAELYTGDVRALPFGAREFDVVVDFGTCYHIDRPAAALREIARVLDVGGVFIHESPLAQLIAHPLRSAGRGLPWHESAELAGQRRALLWASRRKTPSH